MRAVVVTVRGLGSTPDIFYLTGERSDSPIPPTKMASATISQISKDPSTLSGENPKNLSIKFMGVTPASFTEYKTAPQRTIIESKPITTPRMMSPQRVSPTNALPIRLGFVQWMVVAAS